MGMEASLQRQKDQDNQHTLAEMQAIEESIKLLEFENLNRILKMTDPEAQQIALANLEKESLRKSEQRKLLHFKPGEYVDIDGKKNLGRVKAQIVPGCDPGICDVNHKYIVTLIEMGNRRPFEVYGDH